MEGIVMTVQLLLGLSILVGLHEFGHLLAAKAFGMRVEKYSIGFPPKIWGKKWGETEYSIGAIPLGGFVKITGMIDESLDVKSLANEPEPYEFRAKPAWQRLIVMMGGIIVNVITGIIVFIVLTYTQGETYVSKEEVNKYGIVAYELGEQIGLKTGDRILDINGEDYQKFKQLISGDVLLSTDGYYTVDRNGEILKISIPNDFIDNFSDKGDPPAFIGLRSPVTVGRIEKGGNAELAGLQPGDKIIEVNGQPIQFFDELRATLTGFSDDTVTMVLNRQGSVQKLAVRVVDGSIGFYNDPDINLSTTEFTLGESISRGTFNAFNMIWLNIKAFRKMFAGEVSASKSLSGPIGIAKFFGGTWDWINFWQITGLLSMILAFMNFLPIPALDGGHVMFLTWEIVSGRKPSDKFLENAQKVGMVLLLGLMSYAIFNDIWKIIF